MTETVQRQTWRGVPVVIVEWDYKGKHRRVPLDMRTGKHYVPPPPDGALTPTQEQAVLAWFPDAKKAEMPALYHDHAFVRDTAAQLEGK